MPSKRRLISARPSDHRRLGRALSNSMDALPDPVWVLDAQRRIIYFNSATARWLGVSSEEHLLSGLRCVAKADVSNRQDELGMLLSCPSNLSPGGEANLGVQGPGVECLAIRFVRLGIGDSELIFASGGGSLSGPVTLEEIGALHLRDSLNRWRRIASQTGGVVCAGVSAAAARLRGQVRIASETRQHIVILGQKGSGSEWVARSIHERSKGAEDPEEPCLVIDTPLMDAELLEVTLSPALAHLGVPGNRAVTCVLKGVDEAPAEIQERVIDFAKRSPGSVRLIGLCHLPILDGLRAGTITPSMSSALSIFEVRIEPLATRPEDIPLIASALLDQRRESERIAAERIGREAMDLLVLFPWPENFEELDAALRHASQVCRGPVIAPEHLPLAIRTYRPRVARSRPIVSERLDVAMANYELGLIQEAMELCSGNRSEAARRLGISRTRLIRRLEGIGRDSRGRRGHEPT